MKTFSALLLALALALGLNWTAVAETPEEKAAAEKAFEARVTKVLEEYNRLSHGTPQTRASIASVLKDCDRLKPGLTRAEVHRIMTTEGGIFGTTRQTFVHPGCVYVKVDVTFIPAYKGERPPAQTNDVIRTVSAPYVALTISD